MSSTADARRSEHDSFPAERSEAGDTCIMLSQREQTACVSRGPRKHKLDERVTVTAVDSASMILGNLVGRRRGILEPRS